MYDKRKTIDHWRVPPLRTSEAGPLRFSVGYYRGRHRVTAAWFVDYATAQKFANDWRTLKPWLIIDILESFF